LGPTIVTDTQPSMPAGFELPARAASGFVLAVAAVAAVVAGGLPFSILVGVGAIAALREWHRLVNGGHVAREMIPSGLAMVAVVWLAHADNGLEAGLVAILLGAAGAALSAALRRSPARWPIPWHGFGALYVGLPALAFILLRDAPRGAAIVGGIFVAVWSADTGALFCGRMIGGPKLAPVLSPNKTWAGFLGGTLAAGVAEALYAGFLRGSVAQAVVFGIFLALAGHCGDLFESWVKRQFRAKNTGGLIPGHGGVLDRIDSVLFAAPICAMLLFLTGFNPFYGVAP
jgi:phosphatidate cytidylyltransferase